jgi:23S rRNA-/tRNA-specific pseudouridylate synthase
MSSTERTGLPEILYEDNHLIAVNKRPGDIVQGDNTGDAPLGDLLKAYIKEKYKKPGEVFLGVAHRLDRPVSGVVVFARTSKALARMNELFRERRTQKTYWAVVRTAPPQASGSLIHYLKKDEKNNKSRAYVASLAGLPATRKIRPLLLAGSFTAYRKAPSDPSPAFNHGMSDKR